MDNTKCDCCKKPAVRRVRVEKEFSRRKDGFAYLCQPHYEEVEKLLKQHIREMAQEIIDNDGIPDSW
jgi:hypothetical protein